MITRDGNGTLGACVRRLLAPAALALIVGLAPPAIAQTTAPAAPAVPSLSAPVPAAPKPATVPASPSSGAPASAQVPRPAAPTAAPGAPAAPAAVPSPSGAHDGHGAAAVPPAPPAPATPGVPAAVPAIPAPGAMAAPAAPAAATQVAEQNAMLPHDLSPWGMFMAADLVVKAVMIGLAFASVVTWTVWLAKSLELVLARHQVARTFAALKGATSLHGSLRGAPERGAAPALIRAALSEVEASPGLPAEGIKERVGIALSRIEAKAGRRMTVGTGLLATIGATAPFVGLFGTVWGIMNAFIGISKAQTTNLAVVAPGIAEALLATAIGLVAAIPAVVIYNMFARSIAGYRATLADTSSEVMRHLSRDLDRADAAGGVKLRHAAE